MKKNRQMSPTSISTKLITKAAREVLRPEGLIQKGKSRIWIDDHEWWAGVVEFQPSGFSKGSYLNVSACWLWHRRPYITFDVLPHRKESFISYESDEQFFESAMSLARKALEEITFLRRRFYNISAVAKYFHYHPRLELWNHFDAGIAFYFAEQFESAKSHFSQVLVKADEDGRDGSLEAGKDAKKLLEIIEKPELFKEEIISRINFRRRALKLNEVDSLSDFD